jgi:hypothetical protein
MLKRKVNIKSRRGAEKNGFFGKHEGHEGREEKGIF